MEHLSSANCLLFIWQLNDYQCAFIYSLGLGKGNGNNLASLVEKISGLNKVFWDNPGLKEMRQMNTIPGPSNVSAYLQAYSLS